MVFCGVGRVVRAKRSNDSTGPMMCYKVIFCAVKCMTGRLRQLAMRVRRNVQNNTPKESPKESPKE